MRAIGVQYSAGTRREELPVPMTLPLAPEAPAATWTSAEEKRGRLRVLMVDDDLESLLRTLDVLRAGGDWATGVQSAEGALVRFLEGAFDVLITRVQLPGLPGTVLAQKLRERAELPVIYLGAPDLARLPSWAFVLSTPYTVRELQAALTWAAGYPQGAQGAHAQHA
jgi:CheY-like chemotaxis protein